MNILFAAKRRVLAIALALAFLAGNAYAADGVVRGNVTYEKILHRNPATGKAGLQIDAPVARPVVGARVELVTEENTVAASGVTDQGGGYRLVWSGAGRMAVRVRVWAEAEHVAIVNEDDPRTTFSIASEPWQLEQGEATKHLTAKDANRASGPFNILAAVQIGNRLLRATEPGIEFPKVRIHWSARPRQGTSYFVYEKNEIHLLGDRADDSDEFDDCIVLHEYGHYVAANFSKGPSRGGPHQTDRIDPRVAWNEGWASFFACVALGDSRYADTGVSRADGSGIRLEYDINVLSMNSERLGYGNERTVARVLWSIFAKPSDKKHLGLGFEPMWRLLRSQAWKDRSAYRCLTDFCDELMKAHPELAPRLVEILAANGIRYVGEQPKVADPYVRPLVLGTAASGEVSSFGPNLFNEYGATAVYSIRLTEQTKVKLLLEITESRRKEAADLDLFLFDAEDRARGRSELVNGVGDAETIVRTLEPGVYYVEVRSFGNKSNAGAYRLTASH